MGSGAAASAATGMEGDFMGRTSKELGKDRAAGRSLSTAPAQTRPGQALPLKAQRR
jgi:hypothetical protein